MRVIGMLNVVFGVLLSGALLGSLVFAGWLLATPEGARWVLDALPQDTRIQLQVEQIEGRLLGPLEIRGLRVHTESVDVELDRARLVWSPVALLRGTLSVRSLDLGVLRVQVRDRAEDPDDPPPRIPELPIALELRQASLQRLELRLPAQDTAQIVEAISLQDASWRGARAAVGALRARHALTGELQAAAAAELSRHAIELRSASVQTAGETPSRLFASGSVNLDERPSRLDLGWSALRWPLQGEPQVTSREGQLRIEGRPADLVVQGAFALGDQAQVQLKAQRSADQLQAQLAWTKLTWPLQGLARVVSAQGRADLSGSVQAYRYTLEAQLAAEGQQGQASAAGTGGLDHVVLETLRLAVATSEVEGRARIDWKPVFTADADLRVKNLDPGLVAPDWPGRLNGALKARTQWIQGQPRVQFEVALQNSRLRSYPLALQAVGKAEGKTVNLDRFQLTSGRTQLQAHGQVTPPFDVSAKLDSPDLAALWPGLSGNATLDAQLRGSMASPHLIARGSANQLAYQTVSIEQVRLQADLDQAGPWSLDLQVQTLRGPTAMSSARLQVDGQASAHRLRLNVDADTATAELLAQGRYDAQARRWSGEVASGTLTPRGLATWTLEEPAALRVEAGEQQLEPACWRALESRLCAQLTREAGRMRAAFRVEQIDFAYFASFLPAGWELRGGIDGTGLVEMRDARLVEARADLATDPIELRRDGELLLSAERGSLRVEETAGRTVAALRLPLRGGQIAFDAELAPGPADYLARPLNAQLDVGLSDLGFLRLASEEIERVSGRLEGRLRWTGTLAHARAEGELNLSEGQMRLATPGIELRQISATATATSAGALRIVADAMSGEGKLTLSGEASTAGQTPTARLVLRGENFQAANTAEARAWISPRLDIRIDGREVQVSGDVDVPRADIKPLSFDGGVAPSRDQIILTGEETPTGPAGLRLSADVRLNLGAKVSFEGFGLKTRLEGSVRAIEQAGRPGSGRGEVRLVGGRYKAYGQDLEIEYGRLLFNGGPLTEPAIEIRAQRKPREDVLVGVLVRGTLDRPEFSLYSTPAMPRERQLSWLVLGRSLDEEGSAADDKAMIANAALALGLGGTDFLAQNLRGGLRLDEVSIGATPGEDAQTARFTVGKYLSTKLYVSYGIGLFQPGQVFKLLYTLGHGFKFSTESGVHTGGDLLYTVERK